MAVHPHEAGLCEQGHLLTPLPLQGVTLLGPAFAALQVLLLCFITRKFSVSTARSLA